MSKTVMVFAIGILLALLTVGGYFASRTFFASADPSMEPQNVVVTRSSPTAGEVTFLTEKPAVASLECSTIMDGDYEVCGSETSASTSHKLKTSIILDPEKVYYFYILIGNVRYDNLGRPLMFEKSDEAGNDPSTFPTQLIGVCEDDPQYVKEYDLNNDGCILLNDRSLYGQ